MRSLLAVLGCGVVAAAHLPAAEAQDLKSCSTIDDDAARLACYDRLAGRSNEAATAGSTPVAASAPERAVAPSAPAAATAAAAPVTAAAAAAAATAEQDFGLTPAAKKAREPEAAEPARPESIERTIAAVARDGQDRFVVTLDDGQVWAQNEPKAGVHPRKGESVTISRAALGSYVLRSQRFGSIRVRRLK
jgi:hypothetical protein